MIDLKRIGVMSARTHEVRQAPTFGSNAPEIVAHSASSKAFWVRGVEFTR